MCKTWRLINFPTAKQKNLKHEKTYQDSPDDFLRCV